MKSKKGFTLIELMVIVGILGILYTLAMPRYVIMHQKANQAKTRGNLAVLRTTIQIYFSDTEGQFPLQAVFVPAPAPTGVGGESLITTLYPKYLPTIPAPYLMDYNPSYNTLPISYDVAAAQKMALDPPEDVWIMHGKAQPTTANYPYGYDNRDGNLYINSFNLDTGGGYFYHW